MSELYVVLSNWGSLALILTPVLRRQLGALLVANIPFFVSSFTVSFDDGYNGNYTIADPYNIVDGLPPADQRP